MSAPRMGCLHPEHVLLGASFLPSERDGMLRVESYGNEPHDGGSTMLVDLTGCSYLLVSGADASAFCRTSFAGRDLVVGEAAVEAVLNGTGELLGTPLLMRTGDSEYVVVDASEQSDVIAAWLEFLSNVESDGRRAFPDLSISDATGMLVPLLLAGPDATGVLSDYVRGNEGLPPVGVVRQLRLDAIPAVVARPATASLPPAYIALVPTASARILWRSLLSFTEVEPIGHLGLKRALSQSCPWAQRLEEGAPARVTRRDLDAWGLARSGEDFVGGRSVRP